MSSSPGISRRDVFTIVGSGFGLYGYLPALIERGQAPVLLPQSYRDKLARRADVARLVDRVQWVKSHDAAFELATGVVVAVPPELQGGWVARATNRPGIRELVLEKPLAPSPVGAIETLRLARAKRIRVGYTLLHAGWYPALRAAVARCEHVRISWQFLAHHFRNDLATWKRFHSRGGGPLRLYGIHLIAVLADLGYVTVESSRLTGAVTDQPERWQAVIAGAGLPECTLDVHSRTSSEQFLVQAGGDGHREVIVDAADPFALDADATRLDNRVKPLARLLATLADDDGRWTAVYQATHELWMQAESGRA